MNTHHHKKSKSGKTRSRFSIRSEEVQIFKIYIYLNRYIKTLDQLYLEETYRDEQKRPKTHFFCLSSFLFLRILHFATLFEQAAQGTVCFNKNRKLTNYFELIEKYMLLYILFVFIRNFFFEKLCVESVIELRFDILFTRGPKVMKYFSKCEKNKILSYCIFVFLHNW